MKKYDAIIVGGGHNGLVAAAYLGKIGKSVLVLERRPVVGGAAVTEEIYPGFKYSVCSYVVSLLRPEIVRELDLAAGGLEIIPLDTTFTPLPDGDYILRWSDRFKTRRELLRHSAIDAEAYERYGTLMHQMALATKPLLSTKPPSISPLNVREIIKWLGVLRNWCRLGEETLYDIARLMTASAADFLDEWFETEPLKATMAASGIIGTFMGPRSPGTAYVLLHHYMGEIDGVFRSWGFARGGMGSVSEAIAAAARRFGAEIRTEAQVERVLVSGGRAKGVALAGGEELGADVVISAVDPKRTFLGLLDDRDLEPSFAAQVRRIKMRGSSAKVNLALDRLPEFRSLPGDGPHLRGAISISPSIDYLERAYDDAKYGRYSRQPYLDIVIPSTIDPAMAPPGKHVMSVFIQYAPYHLKDTTWEQERERFGDNVIETLSEYAPNLKKIVLHRQVLTPHDLEREFGLTEGNIFHGELTLDQLFFLRPIPGWAQYRSPIKDLYLCGAGTHPGGGVMGAAGRLAAAEILRDWSAGKIKRD
jgi:phytoene dehydrogenase-like protein